MPKVGSQTAMELMRALALKNNFHYHKDRTQKVETIKLTNNEEVITLLLIYALPSLADPTFYDSFLVIQTVPKTLIILL